ncbi:hypothetical protein MHYP_G00302900 [Metynnis hypsauchen]
MPKREFNAETLNYSLKASGQSQSPLCHPHGRLLFQLPSDQSHRHPIHILSLNHTSYTFTLEPFHARQCEAFQLSSGANVAHQPGVLVEPCSDRGILTSPIPVRVR